jgi:hypothetical protein
MNSAFFGDPLPVKFDKILFNQWKEKQLGKPKGGGFATGPEGGFATGPEGGFATGPEGGGGKVNTKGI